MLQIIIQTRDPAQIEPTSSEKGTGPTKIQDGDH